VSPTSGTEAPSRLRLQRARMGLLLHARAPAAATACGHGVGVGGRARELLAAGARASEQELYSGGHGGNVGENSKFLAYP